MIRQIKITIDSNLKNVSLVGTSINKLCSLLYLTKGECADIELCVVEAVNNAVKHAYENQGGNDVEIVFTIESDRLLIDILDSGKGMEMEKIQEPVFDVDDVESIPESGMGIHIIRSIMDEVSYIREHGKKNRLTMTRYLNSSVVRQFNENST
jgi:serine/threonine-protein kinase RsbW